MPVEEVQLIFRSVSWIFFPLSQSLESRVGGQKEKRQKMKRSRWSHEEDAIKTGHMGDHMLIL